LDAIFFTRIVGIKKVRPPLFQLCGGRTALIIQCGQAVLKICF
jgi:hypothetical protein